VITERNRIVAEMVPDILYLGAARRSTGQKVLESVAYPKNQIKTAPVFLTLKD